MRQGLTDIAIRQLPIPSKGYAKYWDTGLPGFGVRVSQGGTKSFVVMTGKERRLTTIGRYPSISLKEARRAAQVLLANNPTGKTPTLLSEALSAYFADCDKRCRQSTIATYRHYLNQLKRTYLEDVTKTDLPETSHAVMAGKIFFNWCVKHELVEKNPFAHVAVNYGERDRVLKPDEVKAIWQYEHRPFSDHVKIMILTGIRKGECVHLEVEDDTLLIAAENTKNRRAHTLPLTPMVEALLPIPYFNGWSKAKKRLDEHVPLPHWVLHDLRRTFATIHAQIGTPIHVVEALLNHRSGTVSGVAAIYIRHNFLQEARTAQLAYEAHLAKFLDS